jgi:methionyl-tRNA synthetase
MYDHMYGHPGIGPWIVGFLAIAAPFLVIIIFWSLFWKGLALWHSARRREPVWFIIMLLVNTIGILEIVYLFGVAKLKWDELFSYHERH